MTSALIIMILSPLVGAILNGLLIRTPYARRAGVIATSAALVSFLCAVSLYAEVLGGTVTKFQVPWFGAGTLNLNWGFQFDALTAVMALVVTGIGTLIHLYSIGYMSEEKGPYRYFAYLNLFLFNMLLLISSDNLVGLFVGWEGVGLCSYLLIGYWFEDPSKARAGMKAFLVNRIGDAGFLLGIFICYQLFGSIEFASIRETLATKSDLDLWLLNVAAFCLFVGATGKSAQVPLYVWLPDAMAGPTPVSALIHAATMVTAGIYLTVRMEPLFLVTANANQIIAIIGLTTALLAALIATSQRDIKKVLAYSTVSQLGLMFLALGCQAYIAAVFHLMTHAFFKALLFLGSGSVIHALSGEQDISKMGGLRKKLPGTFWTFAIGTVAICGIPPFAGFFSKDTILHAALSVNLLYWIGGGIVATLTAFYMSRLFALTFMGSYRGEAHPHESGPTMMIPLIVLAVGSALTGFLGVPHELHFLPNYLEHFLNGVVQPMPHNELPFSGELAMAVTTGLAVLATLTGLFLFSNPARAAKLAPVFRPLALIFENKFWVDELYGLIFVKPFGALTKFLAKIVDPKLIDGALMGLAKVGRWGGASLSWVQYGAIQFYLLVMLLGTVYVLWVFLKGAMA